IIIWRRRGTALEPASNNQSQAIHDRYEEPNRNGFDRQSALRISHQGQQTDDEGDAVTAAVAEEQTALQIEDENDKARNREDLSHLGHHPVPHEHEAEGPYDEHAWHEPVLPVGHIDGVDDPDGGHGKEDAISPGGKR